MLKSSERAAPTDERTIVTRLLESRIVHPSATILQWCENPRDKQTRSNKYYFNEHFTHEELNSLTILDDHRRRYALFFALKDKEEFSNIGFLLDDLICPAGNNFIFRYLPWNGIDHRFSFDDELLPGTCVLTFYVATNCLYDHRSVQVVISKDDNSFTSKYEQEWKPNDPLVLTDFRDFVRKRVPGHESRLEQDLDILIGRRLQQLDCVYAQDASAIPVQDTLFLPVLSQTLCHGELLDVGHMLVVSYAKTLSNIELQEEFAIYNWHFDKDGLRKGKRELELASEAQKHGNKAAKAALFSRNFSHNIGSHALSHPEFVRELKIGKDTSAETHARSLHLYLQNRYDWISQMVTDGRGAGAQPMRFVGEVLELFFRQRGILSTLVEDQGFDAKDITFTVERDGARVVFKRSLEDDASFVPEEIISSTSFSDVWTAIPSGCVGCQALFSIIENVMRNSSKYARRKDDSKTQMDIHLRLASSHIGTNTVKVTIWDDAAGEAKDGKSLKTLITRVRELEKQPLIKEGGGLTSEGRGLLDMREAARFLGGKLDSDNPFTSELDPENHTLAHTFFLQKPLLLTLLSTDGRKKAESSKCDLWSTCDEISSLFSARRPSIGVLVDSDDLRVSEWVTQIAKSHHLLPFRLLVFCSSARKPSWDEAINATLPRRRLRVLADQDEYGANVQAAINQLLSSDPSASTTGSFCGCDGEEAAILHMFEAWLSAYKEQEIEGGLRLPWKLGVGFERPHSGVERRWSLAEQFQSELVKLVICGLKEGAFQQIHDGNQHQELARRLDDADFLNSGTWKSWLIFDNHGKCFQAQHTARNAKDLFRSQSCGFYAQIGHQAPSLYTTLEAPPTDSFGFGWFVFSVLEAALTKTVIVDERIISDFLSSATFTTRRGLWPVIHVKTEIDKPAIPLTTAAVRNWLSQSGGSLLDEGLNPVCGAVPELSIWDGEGLFHAHTMSPDVIVIHEGIAETIGGAEFWDKMLPQFYRLAPRVVRTSGRGSDVKGLPQSLPFIGYGAIGQFAMLDPDPVALARELLNA